MDSAEFIRQEVAAGCPAHCHGGVWWKTTARGACRPLLPFHEIVPGAARPAWRKSWIGYSHLVPASYPTPRRARYWIMEESALRAYSLKSVSYSIRKPVNRAVRHGLTVARLEDLAPWWDDLRSIAISKAERTGYGQSAEFYRVRFDRWQREIAQEFAKPNREWWGVFKGNRLGAYLYGYQIDGTMYLQVAKVHSDFLAEYASYLLYVSVLEYCRDLPGCRRVNAGALTEAAGVNEFQQKQGFQLAESGEYTAYNPAVRLLLKAVRKLPPPREPADPASAGGKPSRVAALHRHALRMAARLELQANGPDGDGEPSHAERLAGGRE